MPYPLSQAYRDAAYPQETGEAFVFLVTIDHPALEDTIRLTNSGADISTGGVLYVSAPVEVYPPGEREDEPFGRLIVPNVDQRIGEAIEAINSPCQVTITAVLESDPTVIVGGPYEQLLLQRLRGDAMAVEGQLRWPSLAVEAWPKEWISPRQFKAAFRAMT